MDLSRHTSHADPEWAQSPRDRRPRYRLTVRELDTQARRARTNSKEKPRRHLGPRTDKNDG